MPSEGDEIRIFFVELGLQIGIVLNLSDWDASLFGNLARRLPSPSPESGAI